MAKILITLLGTGRSADGETAKNEYIGTDYVIDNKKYKDKKFVSSAIIEHFGINKVFIIGTNKSMWDNIAQYFEADDDTILTILYLKERGTLSQEDLKALNKSIDRKLSENGSKCYIIQDSDNKDALWKIFEKLLEIVDTIHKEDEVYFDITHLFRSVSVMTMILADLGISTDKFKLGGLFYGLLKKNTPSPIVDLKIFFDFLKWNKAVYNLKKFGNSSELKALISDIVNEREIVNGFTNFSNALSIADIGAMQQSIKILKGRTAHFRAHEKRLIKFIANDLEEFIERFSKEDEVDFLFELTKWYIENQNFALAYITLAEATVSMICKQHDLPLDRSGKEEAKKILYEYGDWKSASKEQQKLNEVYRKITDIRNAIAHKTSAKSNPKNSIDNIGKYLDTIYKFYKKN